MFDSYRLLSVCTYADFCCHSAGVHQLFATGGGESTEDLEFTNHNGLDLLVTNGVIGLKV